MLKIRKIAALLMKGIRDSLIAFGILFLILLILALTSAPFWARYRLGKSVACVPENTRTIVLMGAGGFPSESVLMRLWYTNYLTGKFPDATVVIATPGDTLKPQSTIMQMRKTLIGWGIDSTRISYEPVGLNTRFQALEIYKMLMLKVVSEPVVIVTSPEHCYRTVRSFEKAGFSKVSGQPASEAMLETDLRLNSDILGGNTMVPDVGNSISLRYKFWDYLKYEISVIREYIAIAYYWLRGWI